MSATFITAFILALLVVVYWRVALIVLIALLLALLVTGVSAISGGVAQQGRPTIIAPTEPGPNPADASPRSDNLLPGPEENALA